MTPEKNSAADKSQLDNFKKLARDLECNEDEGAFKRTLRKVAKAKPTPAKSAS